MRSLEDRVFDKCMESEYTAGVIQAWAALIVAKTSHVTECKTAIRQSSIPYRVPVTRSILNKDQKRRYYYSSIHRWESLKNT